MDWKSFFEVAVLLTGIIYLIAGIALYVKGRDDAKSFEGELRYLLACIHLFPVTDVAYKTIRDQFTKINKMKGRDKEQISVAFVEFAHKFYAFMKPGPEAEIKNTE